MKSSTLSIYAYYALSIILLVIFIGGCAKKEATENNPTEVIVTITPAPPPTVTPTGYYMKMDPPADSDKPLPVPNGDNSCWLHSAANMLAGAGYGNGTTVQARADDIFANMSAQFGIANGGWTPTALQWWLASSNNTWANDPYTLVTSYGNTTRAPWTGTNAPMTIANELRSCNMVGLAIRWPTDAVDPNGDPIIGEGGHAITLWGDNQASVNALTTNPDGLRVTDSDTDSNGDVQAYTYDAFTNPNPGGPNEGNGWYFNAYGSPHPYISAAFALGRTTAGAGANSVRVTSSFQIQNTSEQAASDLHYKVGTDVDILTYRTWLNWAGVPTIIEDQSRREITVDWVFSKEVPKDSWVTINTEFVETSWNSIHYSDVYFTYGEGAAVLLPYLAWIMETPKIEEAERILNVVGGYVIGSFDVINPKIPDAPVIHYRFVHQYLYNQSPEAHSFLLTGKQTDDVEYTITNLRFGHSYFYPTEEELWLFENWMTKIDQLYPLLEPVKIDINWSGQLPYPEGFPPSTGGNPPIK